MSPMSIQSGEYPTWCDDLRWHRDYGGVKFVWFDDDPFKLAAAFTYGKVEHTTLADLRDLHARVVEIGDFALTIQRAIGQSANRIHRQLPHLDDTQVADELGIPVMEYRIARQMATFAGPDQCTNHAVTRIKDDVWDKLFFKNPMIWTFELKKIWDLYTAAEHVLYDAMADLADELQTTTYPADILRAIGITSYSPTLLTDWLRRHRDERGLPGDPRRRPTTMPVFHYPIIERPNHAAADAYMPAQAALS